MTTPDSSSLVIRPARREDVGLILALVAELADYEKLSHEVVATEEDTVRELFGEGGVAGALLAWQGEEAVGLALYFFNFSTFLGRRGLYLEDLYVQPAWRGKGIGKSLLQALAKVAVEKQCGRMEWAVLDWNTPAIGFYRGLGARILDEWRIVRLDGDGIEALAQS